MTTAIPLVRAGLPAPTRESIPVAGSAVAVPADAEPTIESEDGQYDPVEDMQGTLHWLAARDRPFRTKSLVEVLADDPRNWLTEIRPTADEVKTLDGAWRHLGGMLTTLLLLTDDEHGSALAVVAAVHLVQGARDGC